MTALTAKIRYGNVEAWFEEVGPERAKELLSTYKEDYRKYRPTYGAGLSRDMLNGFWNFDGSPIRIDEDGNLFDGQHRLHAVIDSGKPQIFLIIVGLPVAAYGTTDTGLARSYRDNLRRRGYTNVGLRSALVKLIDNWESGRSLDDGKRRTNAELDIVHDKHVDTINRALEMAGSTHRRVFLSPLLMTFSWWTLAKLDTEKSYTFLVAFAEGENLFRGHPALALRNRLHDDRDEYHTRNEYMHLVYQAWNAFVLDKRITRLTMPKGGFVTIDKMEKPLKPAQDDEE